MITCVFCKIINQEIPTVFLYEDDQIVVFKDIRPKADVHVLVVPKLHIKSLAETDPGHGKLLSHIMLSLNKIAKSAGLSNGFRTIINTGDGGGQEIDHLHVHIIGGKKLTGF